MPDAPGLQLGEEECERRPRDDCEGEAGHLRALRAPAAGSSSYSAFRRLIASRTATSSGALTETVIGDEAYWRESRGVRVRPVEEPATAR